MKNNLIGCLSAAVRSRFNYLAFRNRFFAGNFAFFGAPFAVGWGWPYDYDYAAYGGCWSQAWTSSGSTSAMIMTTMATEQTAEPRPSIGCSRKKGSGFDVRPPG
jgi:hypothetical protein